MADSAPAMLHKINSPYDWPHELDDVIRRLHSPLPPSFANIVNATTSEFRQFVQTTLDQPRLETLAPEERVLASVSQSILSTVASLECLAGYEAADGLPRPKLPLVHSLIRAIAHASDENHRFLSDMPFATPRGCPEHAGVAIALVCRLLGKDDVPWGYLTEEGMVEDTEMQRSDSDVDWDELRTRLPPRLFDAAYDQYLKHHPIYDGDRYPKVEDDFDIYGPFFYRHEGRDEGGGEAGEPEVTLPACAHLVAGSAKKSAVALPAFVVADDDNIETLLASVLYQRHVWGIDMPAVGLCVSKDSTTIRVVLGWLDQDQLDTSRLPLVHIAVGFTPGGETDEGTFDLGTLSGCLRAAWFLLSLDVTALVLPAESQFRDLDWRADSRGAEECSAEDRTAEWARAHASASMQDPSMQEDTQQQEPVPLLLFTSTTPVLTPDVSTSPHLSATSASSASLTSHLYSQGETPPSSPDTPCISQSAEMAKTIRERFIKPSSDATSASDMTKRAHKSVADSESTTPAFLCDREVVLLGDISLEKRPDKVPEEDWQMLRKNIEFYRALVAFYWDEEWTHDPEGTVPRLWFSESERVVLCEQYKRYKEVGGTELPMESSMRTLLTPRIESLLHSCNTQDTLAAAAAGRPVKEAEIRHVWDQLLLNFFVDEAEIVSPNVFLEYYIQLPRNHLLDIAEASTLHEKALEVSSISQALCEKEVDRAHQEYMRVSRSRMPTDHYLLDKVMRALNHARSVDQAVSTECNKISKVTPESFLDAVKTRAAKEPIQGICDALVVNRLDWGEGNESAKDKYAEFVRHLDMAKSLEATLDNFEQSSSGHGYIFRLKTWLEQRRKPPPSPPRRVSQSLTDLPYVVGPPRITTTTASTLPDIQDLLIPSLVVEYKKSDDGTVASAVNQGHMYGCGAIDFRETAGVDPSRPVMTLVADGSRGAINMVCKSKASGITYILERGVPIFDITQPLQALNFATFLIGLRAQCNKDRVAMREEVVKHFNSTDPGSLRKWTKTAQALEMPAIHNKTLYAELKNRVRDRQA